MTTVNCVGVMGKGIALQFKQTFPENFQAYAPPEDLRRGMKRPEMTRDVARLLAATEKYLGQQETREPRPARALVLTAAPSTHLGLVQLDLPAGMGFSGSSSASSASSSSSTSVGGRR